MSFITKPAIIYEFERPRVSDSYFTPFSINEPLYGLSFFGEVVLQSSNLSVFIKPDVFYSGIKPKMFGDFSKPKVSFNKTIPKVLS